MSIEVSPEEYEYEKRLIDKLYKHTYYYAWRRAYNKARLDEWTRYYSTVRRQAIIEKWTPEELAEVDKWITKRIKKTQERVKHWTELHENTYTQLKEELEKFKRKRIVVPPKYTYARIIKDQRIYARVKKKKQTPDPVCEVSVSICFELPYPMTSDEIADYIESEKFKKEHPEWTEEELRRDINEILYCASFKAGRKHKVWRESVYAEQQYEARGIDPDEVVYEGQKRFWLKYYRPETEYSHETIDAWIREVRTYYGRKPLMLKHMRITSIEEYM